MTDFCTIYVVTKDKDEAKNIARILVREKLVACVNIIDVMTSIYIWEGELCEDNESAMFLKTHRNRADYVISRIKELHSYHVPCIVQWGIENGNQDYLDWLEETF
jgi:periplasmic divalent cation tolerance protein